MSKQLETFLRIKHYLLVYNSKTNQNNKKIEQKNQQYCFTNSDSMWIKRSLIIGILNKEYRAAFTDEV